MARFIAFDWGLRRTGIAVTDSAAIIATPLETVKTDDLLDFASKLINSEACAGLIVGIPGLMIGKQTDSTEGIESFIAKLEENHPELTIHKVDESNTSLEAMNALHMGGMKKSQRREKGSLDKVAAAIILQRFLDSGPRL
jgi:putative Holliday junction resolvase